MWKSDEMTIGKMHPTLYICHRFTHTIYPNSYLVYGKVNVALEDLEPEIVCVNLRTGKAEGMGVINSPTYSYSIIVNLQAARKALSSECCLAKGNNSSIKFNPI